MKRPFEWFDVFGSLENTASYGGQKDPLILGIGEALYGFAGSQGSIWVPVHFPRGDYS
jgi:hypothetical protein